MVRRNKITIPKSPVCPNCSSPAQHSDFCTKCGAEINQKPDSSSVNSIFLTILAFPFGLIIAAYHFSLVILIFPFSLIFTLIKKIFPFTYTIGRPIFVIIGGLLTLVGGVLVLLLGSLVIFAIFGFFFFNFATDNQGRWVWERAKTAEERWTEIEEECKEKSSSASLMFFNKNIDKDKMRECLEGYSRRNAAAYTNTTIIASNIGTEFKTTLLNAKGSNYTDALEEFRLQEEAKLKESELKKAAIERRWALDGLTATGAAIKAPEYYRACLKDTSFLGWGPFHGFIRKGKARECFIERHEDLFDSLSVHTIRDMQFRGWSSQKEDVRDILMYINRPESEKLLEKKKEGLAQAANKEKPTKKCSIDLQSYPTELEVTDFTDSNYSGVYQLDGTYNCRPKWTNFTCGKHGDGSDITCYLFLSPEKAGTKSGTWVVQPLPPSDEWNAGAYYRCPGMPWESCSPGWIGGKSVTIKK